MSIAAVQKLNEAITEVSLTDEDRALVAAWLPILEPQIETVARRYYDHLLTTAAGRFLAPDRIDRLFAARIAHWRLLLHADFAGVVDDYGDRLNRGLFDTGFSMRVLSVAADWFVVEFGRFVDACPDLPDAIRADLRVALTRFAFLDLLLAHASQEIAYLD